MNNIEQLEQQLAETKKQIEQLEQQLNEAKKPKKWEPQGGSYFINGGGLILGARCSSTDSKEFGTERPTEELAQKAAKAMRIHNRLLAYVHEFAPDYEPNWDDKNEEKYFVYLDHRNKKYVISSRGLLQFVGVVCMPKHVAEELVKKINSGEVEL